MSNPKPVAELAEDLFREKRAFRRELAGLPVEQKFEIMLRLQRIASEVAKAAGRPSPQPWQLK